MVRTPLTYDVPLHLPGLKAERMRQMLSQRELAERSGVHHVTIARLETGRAAAQYSTIRTLAKALGVKPADLTNGPDEAKP